MSEKTLKFDNIEVNNKECHFSKQPIALNLVNANQILISGKFKHSDTSFKYFVGYKNDNIVKTLWIISPQMKGYIDISIMVENMFLMIEDDSTLVKYNEIWNKIKKIKA